MPMKPKVPCRHPSCAELVEPGQKYCVKHKLFWDRSNWPALCKRRRDRKIPIRFIIIERLAIWQLIQISLGIQNATHLHGVIDNNIENREVSDVDSVIWVWSFFDEGYGANDNGASRRLFIADSISSIR